MSAEEVLLYVYCLLKEWHIGIQNPYEAEIKHQQILQMYALYLSLDEEESKKSERKFWVRPIFRVERRIAQGASENLVSEMAHNDKLKYMEYLRMSQKTFKKLLKKVKPYIQKQHAVREPIPPHTRLHICLRYLATGDSMTSISFAFRVAPNSVSKIIRETCAAIWKALKQLAFPKLTTEFWYQRAREFEEKWNFNHCIGAVDGKQVVIQAPPNSGSTYFNYKNNFGINLMAIADAHYRFIAVDIGAPGRRSDGGVFKESKMGQRFESNALNVPPSDALDENGPILPYVLLGDEAFSLSDYLMRPYPRRGVLDRTQKVFNYRLSRSRRVVENAFGILAARWRIYRTSIKASDKSAVKIIQATTCLHNWLINELLENGNEDHMEPYYHLTPTEGTIHADGLQNIPRTNDNEDFANDLNPINIRDAFAEYFMNSGAVQFQWEKVLTNDF